MTPSDPAPAPPFAPPPPGRSVAEALSRGMKAFGANPALLLAPLSSAAASLAAALLALLLLVATLGLSAVRDLRAILLLRTPWTIQEAGRLVAEIVESPTLLLLGLLVGFVLGGLVLLLAAFLRGGTLGVLVEAERRAPGGAPRAAFRVDGAWTVFRDAGGRHLMRFFWLLNFYGAALSLLAILFFVPLVALFVGVARGNVLLPLLLTLFALPLLVAGAMLTRIVYVAAGRAIVLFDTGAAEAVVRGLARIGDTAGRTFGLYALTLAAGLVLSGLLSLPRILLLFLAVPGGRGSHLAPLLLSFALMGLEMAVLSAYDIFTNGSFLALWSEPPVRAGEAPPVAFSAAPPSLPDPLPA